MAAKKRAPSKTPKRRTPRKQKAGSAGLDPVSCQLDANDATIAPLEKIIEHEGGIVVGRYKEPLGGHPLVTAILPIAKIEPTPFQRDLSDTHHKRLADVIQKTGRFLDPVIAITAPMKKVPQNSGTAPSAPVEKNASRATTPARIAKAMPNRAARKAKGSAWGIA